MHNSNTTEGSVLAPLPPLRVRRLGLFTQHESIVIMRTDCHVCRSEGLRSRSQVVLRAGSREVFATLYQIDGEILGHDEIALSERAWDLLAVEPGAAVEVRHAPELASFSAIRGRIYGDRFSEATLQAIVGDIVVGRYTDVHMTAFLAASSAFPLDHVETIALTRAMVDVGEKLAWPSPVVIDKHCIGGLPGNRTTPIVVAIVAALGLCMPKTSSRAITSPAGTADTMETMAPVNLDVSAIRRVVKTEGGCIVWGGAVNLSPADDMFIQIERELDIDAEGQLIASVLSKKIAAGATRAVIDIPVGPTAKVRSADAGSRLASNLSSVAESFGLSIRCLQTDGMQPVGRGIGPALEARDVLAVLQNALDAPEDLKDRACALAGAALELADARPKGEGVAAARSAIDDGRAWTKFQRICEAQGGMRTPPVARLKHVIAAEQSGHIENIDNRKIARLAKLAGAPDIKAAGLEVHIKLGMKVDVGEPVCSVHAESEGELAYALEYARAHADIIEIAA